MHKAFLIFPALLLACGATQAGVTTDRALTGIATFNRAFAQATRTMDNTAALALWEDDGTSLLPSTPPIIGKRAIAQFLDVIQKQYPGAHMQRFDSECFDIQVSGDLASEWCTEHQIVKLADGKPPFDGRGNMLLVLHRGTDGKWRLRMEMWNQAAAVLTKPRIGS
jgi:uncharacterized protein (TIGR02246 family)